MSISQMAVPGQLSLDQGASAAYSEDRTDDFNGTQKDEMQDPLVLGKAAQRVAALHPELPPMKADFTVIVKPGTEIFVLTATSPSPVYSQAFLDAAMDEYLNFKKAQLYKTTDATADAINEEMKKLDQQMADNDAAMLNFEKNNDVSFLEKESNSGGSYLVNLNQQLDALTTEYNLLGLQDVDETLDRQQAAMQAAAANPTTGTDAGAKGDTALFAYGPIADYQKARQDLASEQAQLADMSTRLKPAHPQIIALNESIKQTAGPDQHAQGPERRGAQDPPRIGRHPDQEPAGADRGAAAEDAAAERPARRVHPAQDHLRPHQVRVRPPARQPRQRGHHHRT